MASPPHIFQSDTIDRAAELGRVVTITCWSCKYSVDRPAAELAELCTQRGWPRTIIEIGERLACSKCGRHWPSFTFG